MFAANRSAAEPGSEATVFAIGVDVVSVIRILSSQTQPAPTGRSQVLLPAILARSASAVSLDGGGAEARWSASRRWGTRSAPGRI